jgi:hypothetical protein
MEATLIAHTESEAISSLPGATKSRQTRLIAQWHKIDDKLICRWISVDC